MIDVEKTVYLRNGLKQNALLQERVESFLNRIKTFPLFSKLNSLKPLGNHQLREKLQSWLSGFEFPASENLRMFPDAFDSRFLEKTNPADNLEREPRLPPVNHSLPERNEKVLREPDRVETIREKPVYFTEHFKNVVQWNERLQMQKRELSEKTHSFAEFEKLKIQDHFTAVQNNRVEEFLFTSKTGEKQEVRKFDFHPDSGQSLHHELNTALMLAGSSGNFEKAPLFKWSHLPVIEKPVQNQAESAAAASDSAIVSVFKAFKAFEIRYSIPAAKAQTLFSDTWLARERAVAKESVHNHYHGCFNTIRQENTIGAEMGEIGTLIRRNLVELMERNLRFNAIGAEVTAGT